jgi:hypothetical protein
MNSEHAHPAFQIEVEFLGGPFDGLQMEIADPLESLGLPVNRRIIAGVTGRARQKPLPVTSVAYYLLIEQEGRYRYCYLASESARELALDDWRL